jgi:hypothetical protein
MVARQLELGVPADRTLCGGLPAQPRWSVVERAIYRDERLCALCRPSSMPSAAACARSEPAAERKHLSSSETLAAANASRLHGAGVQSIP